MDELLIDLERLSQKHKESHPRVVDLIDIVIASVKAGNESVEAVRSILLEEIGRAVISSQGKSR